MHPQPHPGQVQYHSPRITEVDPDCLTPHSDLSLCQNTKLLLCAGDRNQMSVGAALDDIGKTGTWPLQPTVPEAEERVKAVGELGRPWAHNTALLA